MDNKSNITFGCDPEEFVFGPFGGHIHIGKITIWDRIFGNCEKGIHKFEQFLVKEIPPSNFSMKEGTVGGLVLAIDHLTERHYEIRCKKCGIVAR